MPFDQYTTPGEQKRREQKNLEQAQAQGSGQTSATGYNPVTTVDNVSGGTLPTSSVLYLSGLSSDQRELARLGKLFARNWAIPPLYVFGQTNPKHYTSPITGQPLTIKEARLFSDNFGSVAVTSMLQKALTSTTVTPGTTPGGLLQTQNIQTQTLDPNTVGKFAKVLSDHAPDLPFDQALGMSVTLSRKSLDPKMLSNNLDKVEQWLQNSGQSYGPNLAMKYAVSITATGHSLKSTTDMSRLIAGKVGVQQSKALNDSLESIHTISNAASGTQYVSDYLPGAYFNTLQEAQDAISGEYTRTAQSKGQFTVMTDPVTGENLGIGALPEKIIGPDYWDQVNAEAARISADKDAFQNSGFNKLLIKPIGGVMAATGALFQDFWAKNVQLVGEPLADITGALTTVYDPHNKGFSGARQEVLDAAQYQSQRLWGQNTASLAGFGYRKNAATPGQLIAEGFVPQNFQHIAAPIMDFAIGWELDPLVIAGKLRTNYLKGFLAPGVLESGGDLNRFIERARTTAADMPGLESFVAGTEKARSYGSDIRTFLGHMDKFASSKISRRMFDGDSTTLGRTIFRMRGKVEARGTLDLPYMTALKKKVDEAIAAGMSKQDAWKEWQTGIKAHYLGVAPEGTIAQTVIDARVGEGFRANKVAENLKPGQYADVPRFYADNGAWSSTADHQALMADAMGEVSAPQSVMAPLSLEVPGSTFLSEYGPRRLVRSAVSSEGVTEHAIGRRLAALPNMNPGRVLNFNDRPWEYIYEHAVRSGAFTEDEARGFASRMAGIQGSGSAIETRTEKLVDDINNQFFDRAVRQYGLSTDDAEALRQEVFKTQNIANDRFRNQTFGVGLDGKAITEPMFESQLRNQLYVMDPVVVRQGIRHYITLRDRFASLFDRHVLSKAKNIVPAIETADRATRIAWAAQKGTGMAFEAWLRFWKSLTVARPAYVTRVVLGDENLRFLATTQSVSDRLLSIAWGHRASEESKLRDFLDQHFGANMQVGNETVFIPRAGGYEYEAAAAGQVRQADQINEMMRGRSTWSKAMTTDGSWDVMVPSSGPKGNASDHLYWWSHDLVNQARQSEPGSVALRSISEGDDVAGTVAKLKVWAREDRYVTLRSRIGVEPDQIDEWADRVSKVMHNYTANSKELASLALEGDATKLQKAMGNLIPVVEKRPIVHSPTLVTAVDGGIGTKVTNKLYDWFVRQPEDSLNRQPFYSIQKRRAEAAMYNILGKTTAEVDPAIRTGISNAARDFALGQVRRVMFDFTKQSRFTELLQFVFPFPQPFFEGFQAWGHIAYRNPTALVHGKQLFDLGVQSGFVKKDPLSGEYMVPLTYPYKLALEGLAYGLHVDPRLIKQFDSPWTPLSSLNMISASTVKFGAEGPIGAAIGGVPIPFPSMHPPLQALLQWANKNTTSPLAQGYLFQYGPGTTIFPRSVVAAAGIVGVDLTGKTGESSRQSLALSITDALHRYGMDVDNNGHPIPLNEQERQKFSAADPNYTYDGPTLEEIANDQAGKLLETRNLVNLFSPGAVRTSFDGQREDYTAFQNMIDANGGDFAKANEQWMTENANDPSKWFVPAGKTLAGEGYGEGNTAVRLPPSELVYQMFRMDGIGDLMRNSKQWAALMLVGTDPSVQNEQNFMAFSDLIAKGDIRYKTPAEYYQSAVDGAGWQAYNDWKASHYAVVEHNVEKYGSYESWQSRDSYKEYAAKRREFFNQMYTTNPHWVVHNLVYSEQTKSWDWKGGYDTSSNDTLAARNDLKHIVYSPDLQGFPGVQAMRGYIDATDTLQQKMEHNYLNDINSSRAQDMGLFKQYQTAVMDTVNAAPDTRYFLSKYFNVSFDEKGNVTSTGDLVFNSSESEQRWADVPQNLRDNLVKLDQHLYDFKNQARESAMSPLEVAVDYNKADNLMRRTWEQDPKVLKAWWKSRNASEQQDYKEYGATKNIEYWTPFDFATIPTKGNDIKLGKRAQNWMQQWADARLQITRLSDQNEKNPNSNFSASALYGQISAHLRTLQGKDKGFDQVIQAANTWGWGIDHVLGYGVNEGTKNAPDFRSESDRIWNQFLTLARQAQGAVNNQGLQGVNYDSDANIRTYRSAQDQARAWVTQHRNHNAAFDEQWRQLNELNGGPIIGTLVLPDDYFGPVDAVNYGG